MNAKLAVMVCVAGALGAHDARGDCPELLVPAYQYPIDGTMWNELANPSSWARINVIFNPDSGPGLGRDLLYESKLDAARAAGCRIFAYVYTSYGARSAFDVSFDVNRYRVYYPGRIDGVFFDEMDNQPGSLAYYQNLRAEIRLLLPNAIIIGNPGTSVPESFIAQNAADVIVTYENAADNPLDLYSTATPPAWTANYPPSRFAHIVYNVPNADAMRSTLNLASSRRVGMVYVTDDTLPNPYDTLPAYYRLETRGCIADFNCSGGVTVQDVFDFLSAWFAGSTRADVNDSVTITVQDTFDFLRAWFSGCA